MKVIEVLQGANQQLKAHAEQAQGNNSRTDSAMLDAQILLAHVMGLSKTKLVTSLNDTLTAAQREAFDRLLARRLKDEPVAYLIGKKEFYGRMFAVNPHVLIPRPATETLVEVALALAKDENTDTAVFADIGAGSGAIAITLAAESAIPVIATEKSPDAMDIARQNAQMNHVEDRVDLREGNLVEPLIKLFEKLASTNVRMQTLILCANLPYLTDYQWQTGQPDIHYEPALALKAGTDGLDAYFDLFKSLKRHRDLFPPRLVCVIEIDPSQSERITILIKHDFPHARPQIKKDLEGLDRVVITEI